MIRAVLCLLLISCLSSGSYAGEPTKYQAPDYDAIKKATSDKRLPTYYPALMSRYRANDTTLREADFSMLYYGFFFHRSEYQHDDALNYNDSIKAVYSKEELMFEDRVNLVRYYKELIKTDPMNLRSTSRLFSLYKKLGDTVNSMYYQFKLEMLARVIFSTGDGRTDSTGIHVLEVGDEYTLLSLLGIEFDGTQTLTANQCDYLKVKPNDYGLEGMYFDVKQIFKGYAEMMGNDRELQKSMKKTIRKLQKSK